MKCPENEGFCVRNQLYICGAMQVYNEDTVYGNCSVGQNFTEGREEGAVDCRRMAKCQKTFGVLLAGCLEAIGFLA